MPWSPCSSRRSGCVASSRHRVHSSAGVRYFVGSILLKNYNKSGCSS